VVHVWHGFGLARRHQLLHGALVGILEALLGYFLAVVGVVRHDALQQLVQRVPDPFMVERRHGDALFCRAQLRRVTVTVLDNIWKLLRGRCELGPTCHHCNPPLWPM
jgi:hypothetical protein